MNELFKCENLSKNYGRVEALKGISLTITRGKIVGLLGPNGSGKTTLIKLMNGLLKANEGTILINGMAPGVLTKSKVSYLPDSSYLNSWMTVEQIVNMFADFYPDFREELALKMLSGLDIDKKRKLKTLSKGNKEKVCLILVMSRNAELYVLDEPIAGVAMTLVEEDNGYGQQVYSYTVSSEYNYIIFSNGNGTQCEDINLNNVSDNGFYLTDNIVNDKGHYGYATYPR